MTDATRIVGVSEIQPNPRDAALEQIAQQNEETKAQSGEYKAFNEETGEISEGAPEEPQVPKDEPKEELKEEAKEEPQEPPEAPPEEPEKPEETVTLRVDGKEIQVPKSKILDAGVRTLQKEVAADKRLEEATRLLRAAQESQKAIQETKNPQPSEQDVAYAIAQALRQGDEAQASAAINALLTAGRQQTIQPKDIQQIVAHEVEATAALNAFQTDYQDVVSDPYLMRLAVDLEDGRLARVAQGIEPPKPLSLAFKEHGEAIRKWRGSTPNTMESKAEAKQSIQTVKAASVRAPAPKTDKPLTASEIIAEMRKGRHQRV